MRAARVTMAGMRSLRARLLALPPEKLDALVAALVLVDGVAEVLLLAQLGSGGKTFACAIAALIAIAAALRRRLPIAAIALAWGGLLAAEQIGPDLVDNVAGPYFATMFITGTAGYVLEGRRLWIGAAIATLLATCSAVVDQNPDDWSDVLFTLALGIGGPMLFGQLLRNRTRLNETLREKASRIEGGHAREAEAAAIDERTRIAGELHDVVAHALSAMTVQASAARRLAERDPDRAREAFAGAEATGRAALTELRRLLGVLLKKDEDLALAPQPSLAHVADLVRRVAAAGLPTALHTEGRQRALPAGVDLTAYRLVQEALTAARDGGGAGRAEVAIRYRDDHVVVAVSDDGGEDGRRLLGMHERVAVYGGELMAAGSPAGGWKITARLPVGGSA